MLLKLYSMQLSVEIQKFQSSLVAAVEVQAVELEERSPYNFQKRSQMDPLF